MLLLLLMLPSAETAGSLSREARLGRDLSDGVAVVVVLLGPAVLLLLLPLPLLLLRTTLQFLSTVKLLRADKLLAFGSSAAAKTERSTPVLAARAEIFSKDAKEGYARDGAARTCKPLDDDMLVYVVRSTHPARGSSQGCW